MVGALAAAGIPWREVSPGRCEACSASRILPTGPCEGSTWCFVYRRTVPPQSTCGSFLERVADEGGTVGSEGLSNCSVSTTAINSHG